MIDFNLESEQSVLGGLMIDPAKWDAISESIFEADFFRAEHQLIFRHIQRLIEAGKPVDVITVAESIESTGKLDKVGGLGYLGDLAQGVPSAANILSYATIVHAKHKEREFHAAIQELSAIADCHGNIAEKIENAVNVLNSLADDKRNSVVSLREATVNVLSSLEQRFASGGEIHGLKTGFLDLDQKTGGLQSGDLIILAGRPSMGKSALAVNIAENVAIKDGLPVLIFSLEMSEEQLATRTLASVGGINLNSLRSSKLSDDDWGNITHASQRAYDAPLFIDPNPMMTVSQMHVRARKIKRASGLSLIIIDYLQLMGEGGENRNNELATITRKLKAMAKDLRVPVLCLAQLSRKVEERADKRPMMSDLRDSGAIEQDADLIVMMYRDDYYNKESDNKGIAECNIVKQRMGETGSVLLTFQGEYSRFKDFAGQYHRETTKQRSRGFSDGKVKAGGGE